MGNRTRKIAEILGKANHSTGKLDSGNLDVNFTDTTFSGNEGITIPVGNTAQRGSTQGQWRYNSQTGYFEGYTGTAFAQLAPAPLITSIDVTEIDSASGSTTDIVLSGANFGSSDTVSLIANDGTTVTPNSYTHTSASSKTINVTDSDFANAKEPYDVKITGPGGVYTLDDQINVDSAPAWDTASGNLGTVYEDTAMASAFTVSATDPDGDTVSYSETGGTVIASTLGLTLNSSTGAISGTPNAGDGSYASGGQTHNFTLRATANGKTADRAFNILRKWNDGSSSAQAAVNADYIKTLTSATSSDDGLYWIKPSGRSAIQVYCEFNSFGGWMLFCQSDGSSSPVPSVTSATGTITTLLGGNKGKHADADFNAIDWSYCWHGMTDNNTDGSGSGSGNNTMDAARQNFTTSGTKFTINWTSSSNSVLTSGNTDNGRNQTWSYKSLTGSGGSFLTGSARQPGSNITNTDGSTDYAVGNTNSYYIGSHDAGTGGSWIHSVDGGSGGNMNTGFGSDYNNVPWTARYAYWFFK